MLSGATPDPHGLANARSAARLKEHGRKRCASVTAAVRGAELHALLGGGGRPQQAVLDRRPRDFHRHIPEGDHCTNNVIRARPPRRYRRKRSRC